MKHKITLYLLLISGDMVNGSPVEKQMNLCRVVELDFIPPIGFCFLFDWANEPNFFKFEVNSINYRVEEQRMSITKYMDFPSIAKMEVFANGLVQSAGFEDMAEYSKKWKSE